MALILKDRISETTTTTGTGALTLAGATQGFQAFSTIGNSNTTYYCITDGSAWEVGLGTYSSSGNTLARTTVFATSSGTTSPITLGVGTKNVFAVYPADRAVVVDGTTIQVPNSATLPISAGGTGSATASFSGANITSINANNVSSGILAVAQGGTGSATAAFSGENITSLNASNVSSGVLALANGGTGSSTATFSGANITSLNASNISSGTLDNARTSASSANGASTIVARDASGNFAGATITATTFSGSGSSLTSLNASNVSSGILAVANGGTGSSTATFSGANITSLNASAISSGTIDNARTTASSANGANTIVSRDASGDFAADIITANSFAGSGASLTSINADAITSGTIANARTTATHVNGASTIVARDASGNFAGAAITGTSFSGDGSSLTSLNGSSISSGTVANARTTASSSNGASTIVARDASGNFSANTITATLSGNATNISAYTINQSLGTANGPTFTELYNNGWFRNNNTGNGLYNQATGRGIWSAENYNSYGSYTTYGSGVNGWIGWAIQSTFHFMARNNTDCGLYDSSNGKWLIYGLYNSNGVGINTSTTSTSYGAYIGGALYATGNVVAYSDQRKKENIITVNDPVNILMNLRGVYYNRIDDKDKKRQIGVIAQEVEKVLPEVVTYAPDVDEYGVSYGNFAGLFIEVLKTQQKEIALLKQEIEQLKGLKNGNDNYN